MDISGVIRKCAILNRIRYGKADRKAVMGKVLCEVPEAKKDIKGLVDEIEKIISEVNGLSLKELEGYELKKEKKKRRSKLRLPGNPADVVMRFAPNPNGPATLGSARGIVVNSKLAREYGGKFILRFDDTDPKTKKPMPEAYNWYLEDCVWLNAKPDEVYYASDRIPSYYEYAEKLISLGYAYVCFCSQSVFKELRDSKRGCPHRDTEPKENMKHWKDMLDGRYKEGECVLRIKTDIRHKDPALRDWVAFRIVKEEHPRVGSKYILWPMLDFESAIEDHLLGITHIIRGKDLIDSEHRQKFVYNYLGWKYPVTMHWGRVRLKESGKFSTSRLKEMISRGEYSGWDDPRVPSILAMRRRGVSPQAVVNLMEGLGINETDIVISLENLFAENRKIMDSEANRYFFVGDPVELLVRNAPEKTVEMPFHPSFRNRGFRKFKVSADSKGDIKLFISSDDASRLEKRQTVRLMNLFNVEITCVDDSFEAVYLREKVLDVYKIHWLQDHLSAKVVTPRGVVSGFCEPLCEKLETGDIIQFERFGFVRLDSKADNLIFYFGHK